MIHHYWARYFPRSNDLRYTSSKTFQEASSPLNDVVKTPKLLLCSDVPHHYTSRDKKDMNSLQRNKKMKIDLA